MEEDEFPPEVTHGTNNRRLFDVYQTVSPTVSSSVSVVPPTNPMPIFVLPVNAMGSISIIEKHMPDMVEHIRSGGGVWAPGSREYTAYQEIFGAGGYNFRDLYSGGSTVLSSQWNDSPKPNHRLSGFSMSCASFDDPSIPDHMQFRTIQIWVKGDINECALASALDLSNKSVRDGTPGSGEVGETISLTIDNPPSLAIFDPARKHHPDDWDPPVAHLPEISFSWDASKMPLIRDGIIDTLRQRRETHDRKPDRAVSSPNIYQGFYVPVNCNIGRGYLYLMYVSQPWKRPELFDWEFMVFTTNPRFLSDIRTQMVEDSATVMEIIRAVRSREIDVRDHDVPVDFENYLTGRTSDSVYRWRNKMLQLHTPGVLSFEEMRKIATEDVDTIPDPEGPGALMFASRVINADPNPLLRAAKTVCFYDLWLTGRQ